MEPPREILPTRTIIVASQNKSSEVLRSHIMLSVQQGFHTTVSAVPGAGKTSLLLSVPTHIPTRRGILVTYNKSLQISMEEHIKIKDMKQISAFTFHGFAGKLYERVIRDDTALLDALMSVEMDESILDEINYLMLDECQDMVPLYFVLLLKVLLLRPNMQLIMVGDENQSINGYRGASSLFLSRAPFLFDTFANIPISKWKSFTLPHSYRLTLSLCKFVNYIFKGQGDMKSSSTGSPGPLPVYIAYTGFPLKCLYETAMKAVQRFGPGNVLIIAPSVRGPTSPIGRMIQKGLGNVPIYWEADSGTQSKSSAIAGKVACMSIHASKGIERKACIMLSFDESYFRFCRDWGNQDALPNILYVGATRASEQLYILANREYTLRTIMDTEDLTSIATVQGSPLVGRALTFPSQTTPSISPISSISTEGAVTALKYLQTVESSSYTSHTLFPAYVTFSNSTEQVSEYIHSTIRSMMYMHVLPEHIEVKLTPRQIKLLPMIVQRNIRTILRTPCHERRPCQWVTMAVAEDALRLGRFHLARQIEDYEWVPEEEINHHVESILHTLPKKKFHPLDRVETFVGSIKLKLLRSADEEDLFMSSYEDVSTVECMYMLALLVHYKNLRRIHHVVITSGTKNIYAVRDRDAAERILLQARSHSATVCDEPDLIQRVSDLTSLCRLDYKSLR